MRISDWSSDVCSSDLIHFWAEHDLVTLGVVYDPAEGQAYWVDLQAASRNFRRHNRMSYTTFLFAKALWNRFDNEQFPSVLLPTLLGEAPHVALETLMNWVHSIDLEDRKTFVEGKSVSVRVDLGVRSSIKKKKMKIKKI